MDISHQSEIVLVVILTTPRVARYCRVTAHSKPQFCTKAMWRRLSAKSILGSGQKEERLLEFIKDIKVDIRLADNIVAPPAKEAEEVHFMDMLNELLEF